MCENEINKFRDLKKDIKITTFLNDLYVFADRDGFAKALDNLISNAIKYNKPNGFVKITIKEKILTIQDGGVGISEDEIFKVFDAYYQGNHDRVGYGIGLSVVKSFCDEHKIAINIESKKDEGAKFTLNLSSIVL